MTFYRGILSIPIGRTMMRLVLVVLCATIGLTAVVLAAMAGGLAGLCITILIIGSAFGAVAAFRAIHDLRAQLAAVNLTLHALHRRLGHPQSSNHEAESNPDADPGTQTLDLAAIGSGNPDVMVAATLDRDRFPRLAGTMDRKPVAGGGKESGKVQPTDRLRAGTVQPRGADIEGEVGERVYRAALTNLLRQWKLGLRTGDLPACRAALSALDATLEPESRAVLDAQLEGLGDRVECALRQEFARHARAGNLDGLLEVGDRIRRLLPERPVAEEFQRLRPHLLRRTSRDYEPLLPPLRVVHE